MKIFASIVAMTMLNMYISHVYRRSTLAWINVPIGVGVYALHYTDNLNDVTAVVIDALCVGLVFLIVRSDINLYEQPITQASDKILSALRGYLPSSESSKPLSPADKYYGGYVSSVSGGSAPSN